MKEAQIQLEKNKLPLYEAEKKRFGKLAHHYFILVSKTRQLIADMEAELIVEAKEAEAEAEAEAKEE